MHPAWYIDDIKYLIFEHLERPDLARLARISKHFFDIATDELWTTIDSFEALVCCLPPDFGDRPLQREDIQRLDFYTSKVRHIQLEIDINKPAIKLPPAFIRNKKSVIQETRCKKTWKELWEEVAVVRPPSQLFCNLRYLRVNNVVEEVLIPLIGISGASMTRIYIKYLQAVASDSVVRRILDGFQDTPNLEYLFVRDGESGLIPAKVIQQSPLKHLRLDPRKTIKHYTLSQLQQQIPIRHHVLQKSTIEHLTIALGNQWYTPKIKAMGGNYLPYLKTLWLNLKDFYSGWRCKSCVDSKPPSWVSDCSEVAHYQNMSPCTFIEGLDNPELRLLNIKFPENTSGRMVQDIASAVSRGCRLGSLTDLSLAGSQGARWHGYTGPMIMPEELRMAIKMLLPLQSLKNLRISVAPNFLDVLDLKLYESIAEGLPVLETLSLGHRNFVSTSSGYHFIQLQDHERVPLPHLAAFCQMLPHLQEVSASAVDPEPPGTAPSPEFACPSVKSAQILPWTTNVKELPPEELLQGVQMYFPNSNQAKNGKTSS